MIRDKWIIGVRNKIANMAIEYDSCAAIEESMLTSQERKELKDLLTKSLNYIDERI